MNATGQPHAPASLPQGKRHWYPLSRRLGVTLVRYRRFGQEISLTTAGIRSQVIRPVP